MILRLSLIISALLFAPFSAFAQDANSETTLVFTCESQDSTLANKPDPVTMWMNQERHTFAVEFEHGEQTLRVKIEPLSNTEFMGVWNDQLVFFEYLPNWEFLLAVGERVVKLDCILNPELYNKKSAL